MGSQFDNTTEGFFKVSGTRDFNKSRLSNKKLIHWRSRRCPVSGCPLTSLGGGEAGCPDFPNDSYLVDPASSHMLVSKIKPCMSKYKQIYTVKLRMAH